jgi:hypothetical protein
MAEEKTEIETGEVSETSEYRRLTEAEVKQLALGVMHGQVFGTWDVPKHDEQLIPSIFMVLSLMGDIARKELRRDGVVHLFEEVSKARPQAINGYPIFMSCRMLNAEDNDRLKNKIAQIEKALETI